jgi:hypothetical protein
MRWISAPCVPLVAVFLLAADLHAREINSVKFEVLPSSTVALAYKPSKVEWVLGKIRIEGQVQNVGLDDYEWVEVVYTAYDRNRNVLGSDIWHVVPYDLPSGATGKVDGDLISTKGRIPALIEVEITGDLPE